jgi:hypothetical protein
MIQKRTVLHLIQARVYLHAIPMKHLLRTDLDPRRSFTAFKAALHLMVAPEKSDDRDLHSRARPHNDARAWR